MQIKWGSGPKKIEKETNENNLDANGELAIDSQGEDSGKSKKRTARNRNAAERKKAVEPTIVKIILENLNTGKLLEIFQEIATADDDLNFWQVPVGPYFIDSMSVVGTNFKTSSSFGYNIYTKSGTLANLGTFYIRPQKYSDVLIVKRKPLVYYQLTSEFGFEGVKLISAYTGKLQRILAPTPRFDPQDIAVDNDDNSEERERVKINVELKDRDKTVILTPVESEGYVAEVSYKVKLRKNSQLAPMIAQTLSAYEDQMQNCYQGEIDLGNIFKGTLNYRFKMQKNQKKLIKIMPSSRNHEQKTLNECLVSALRLIEFEEPVSIDGKIEIKFSMN